MPTAKQVAFLVNVQYPIHGALIKAAEHAARELGLALDQSRVRETVDALEAAFVEIRKRPVGAVVVSGDAMLRANRVIE